MKALVVCKYNSDEKENKVCNLISHHNIEIIHAWKNTLSKKDLKDIDLVISIGGDGTALSASHYLTEAPLLAVNDSPETSMGALTTTTLNQLHNKLDEIQRNTHKTELLERIEIIINDKKLDTLALNDVFIANEKAYLISKYTIDFNNIKETHLSSGLIFSTGTGSTAWFHSAGGTPFSPQAKHIKMIVREPYQGKTCKCSAKNLTINENQEITIIPHTSSVLAIDSIREYKLNQGDKIIIKISKHPLKRIK